MTRATRKIQPEPESKPLPTGQLAGCTAHVPCGRDNHDGRCCFSVRVREPHAHDPDGSCPLVRDAHQRWLTTKEPF